LLRKHFGESEEIRLARLSAIFPQGLKNSCISISVNYIPINAICNVNVVVSIQVKICQETGPTPIGISYSGHVGDLSETPIAIIDLQHIVHVIVVVAFGDHFFESVYRSHAHGRFRAHIIFRIHVEGKEVEQTVIVDVPHITSHTVEGNVFHDFRPSFPKASVAIVEVDEIGNFEIIADIDIQPGISIEVPHLWI